MELKLDVQGINVTLKIEGFVKSTKEKWDDQWCTCTFSLTSYDWLNYHKENYEVLLSCEVEDLEKTLTQLLNDELTNQKEFVCIEPDFVFDIHPKRDLRNDPKYIRIQKGYEIADIYVEWRVYFWSDGLTDNYLTITLGRDEIIEFRNYLSHIIKS